MLILYIEAKTRKQSHGNKVLSKKIKENSKATLVKDGAIPHVPTICMLLIKRLKITWYQMVRLLIGCKPLKIVGALTFKIKRPKVCVYLQKP